jgi:hypothetical protein
MANTRCKAATSNGAPCETRPTRLVRVFGQELPMCTLHANRTKALALRKKTNIVPVEVTISELPKEAA